MKKNYTMKAWKTARILLAFQLSAGLAMAQAPANDDCSGAITLTPSSDAVCTAPVTGSGLNATMSAQTPSCALFTATSDVWYSFTASATFHKAILSNISATNTNASYYYYLITAYSGTCSGLTEIAGDYEFNVGSTASGPDLNLSGLTIGQTYYIQISGDNAYDANFNIVSNSINFSLCLTSPPPLVLPVNDDCTGAIAIMGTSATITGNNTNATQTMPQSTCGSTNVANDIWYSFTPTATGNVTIDINQSDVDVIAEVLSGICGTLSSVTCTDDSYPLTVPVTAGVTYYLRVYGFNEEEGSFDVTFGGVALPVTGSKLSGTVQNNRAALVWSTFSEHNNKGFMIQRSADGRTFRNAGWVESKAPRGNSTNTLNYSFSDGEAITGTTYYKLQQTDIDGKTTWSDILPLSAGNDASFTVVAAPNPVSQKLSLTTLGTQGRNATISVADITGKQVKTIVVTGNETEIDMSSLSRGMYLIRYHDDNHIQTIKVTRQ
jgi:hypothetical protein